MPIFKATNSVPAGGVVNPLTGSIYEYLPFNAALEIALVQQTGTAGGILATVNSGPDTLQEEGPITVKAGSPVYPDDFDLTDEAAQGDRLAIRLRNTTAGALVVLTTIKFNV